MEVGVQAASVLSGSAVGVAIIVVLMWAARRYAGKHPPEELVKVTDPVCGMIVGDDQAAAKVEYAGKTYYFCSDACHKRFMVEPAKYAA